MHIYEELKIAKNLCLMAKSWLYQAVSSGSLIYRKVCDKSLHIFQMRWRNSIAKNDDMGIAEFKLHTWISK